MYKNDLYVYIAVCLHAFLCPTQVPEMFLIIDVIILLSMTFKQNKNFMKTILANSYHENKSSSG
jgi:hypothetical protein